MMALGIFLLVLGLIMLIWPTGLWLLTESWKTNDGDGPSRLYKWSTRFGGILCTLIGIANIIVLFL
ncbi:hypothetical protein IM538_08225 [Cytobacillus suaedae]|nr:hypothetical protein IM538_08225 [Cytobacillus suaedae]